VINIFIETYGFKIIGLHKTGVTYTSQCGGLACLQKSAEGFLIPLYFPFEDLKKRYQQFDCSTLCLENNHTFTKQEIEEYNSLLNITITVNGINYVGIDERRLSEATESWIPVIFKLGSGQPDKIWEGIFISDNCD